MNTEIIRTERHWTTQSMRCARLDRNSTRTRSTRGSPLPEHAGMLTELAIELLLDAFEESESDAVETATPTLLRRCLRL